MLYTIAASSRGQEKYFVRKTTIKGIIQKIITQEIAPIQFLLSLKTFRLERASLNNWLLVGTISSPFSFCQP
jgi:hypothetical protein